MYLRGAGKAAEIIGHQHHDVFWDHRDESRVFSTSANFCSHQVALELKTGRGEILTYFVLPGAGSRGRGGGAGAAHGTGVLGPPVHGAAPAARAVRRCAGGEIPSLPGSPTGDLGYRG